MRKNHRLVSNLVLDICWLCHSELIYVGQGQRPVQLICWPQCWWETSVCWHMCELSTLLFYVYMRKGCNPSLVSVFRKWASSTSSMLISWTWRRRPQSTWWGTSTSPTRMPGSVWGVLVWRATLTPFRSPNCQVRTPTVGRFLTPVLKETFSNLTEHFWTLSPTGGQKARVVFAELSCRQPDVLILVRTTLTHYPNHTAA